jgi:AraC-like DNA-binding protein
MSQLKTIADPAARPIAGAMVQDEFDMVTPWHHHDMHQIQYAFDGALEVEDRSRRSLLPKQLAAWIPAGVEHRTSLHRVQSGSVLLAAHLVPDAGQRVRIIPVSPLMREMVKAAMRWPLSTPLDAAGEVYFRAFAMLCGEWIAAEAPLSLPTSDDPALRTAMEHARASSETTILTASRAAGMSERTLRRRFQSLGMSWDDYRRRARLLAALDLLSTTKLSVREIADRVGYESQSALAKSFRALLGVSPTDFRRQR